MFDQAMKIPDLPSQNSPHPAISADFEVVRVQTMADKSIRVVLEMPEHMIPQMGMFAECHRNGIYLHGEFTATDPKGKKNAWSIT